MEFIKEKVIERLKKFGKKGLIIFLIYFVIKWTLTIVFGAKLIAWWKGAA